MTPFRKSVAIEICPCDTCSLREWCKENLEACGEYLYWLENGEDAGLPWREPSRELFLRESA